SGGCTGTARYISVRSRSRAEVILMRAHPIAIALAISLVASAVSAGSGLPPVSSKPGSATEFERRMSQDCHRDLRRHRINGVMVLHRHVGDRCKVRVVREMSSF